MRAPVPGPGRHDPVPARAARAARAVGTMPGEGNMVEGITISRPEKLLYPEAKLSKLDLARYYAAVGERLLPHLRDRPLSLVRCPDGWDAQCFYQKHADRAVNAAVARLSAPESGGMATYLAANSVAAIVGLLQWGVLELHPWGARAPKLDRPDRLILDFDPDRAVPWSQVADAVTMGRKLLEELGLQGFLKTTGGKGLHIVVPIRPTLTWERAKGFTRAIAELMTRSYPDRFTAVMSKTRRKGKIFIDYLRNAQGATAVAPYSLRARAHAPVATPIAWSELDHDVRFDHFNARNIGERLQSVRDPWQAFAEVRQTVTAAILKRVGTTTA